MMAVLPTPESPKKMTLLFLRDLILLDTELIISILIIKHFINNSKPYIILCKK